MKIPCFSIRDVKSGFSCPFTASNEAVAKRQFSGCVNSVGNVIHDYPEDFQLWDVGEFDTESGNLLPSPPMFIVDAYSLVSKEIEEVNNSDEKTV